MKILNYRNSRLFKALKILNSKKDFFLRYHFSWTYSNYLINPYLKKKQSGARFNEIVNLELYLGLIQTKTITDGLELFFL